MHLLLLGFGIFSAVLAPRRYSFNRHRIGHHVLKDITDRCQQHGKNVPRIQGKHARHPIGVPGQPDHDQEACSHQCGSQIDK